MTTIPTPAAIPVGLPVSKAVLVFGPLAEWLLAPKRDTALDDRLPVAG